jgi:2-dehydro-3-deoxygluconokinase
MTRVLAIGECMVERRPDGTEAFAGDAFNVAAHIKRLSPETSVEFLSVTGESSVSLRLRAAWNRLGVGDFLSPSVPGGRVGTYVVETDSAGERRFTYDRSASAARLWLRELSRRPEALAGADLLFLTGVSLAILPPEDRAPALAFVSALKPEKLVFDPNLRPSLWESREAVIEVVEAAMARADILLPSLDDLTGLWGAAPPEVLLERCRSLGPAEIALTLGPAGCLISSPGEPLRRLPAPPAEVIDTAGAGDAFDGAYLAARLSGETPEAAALAGLDRAAQVVALRGALPMELFA